MADPKGGKPDDYIRYAEHCLDIAREMTNDGRAVNRDMATTWLRLAASFIERSKPIKSRRRTPP